MRRLEMAHARSACVHHPDGGLDHGVFLFKINWREVSFQIGVIYLVVKTHAFLFAHALLAEPKFDEQMRGLFGNNH